MRDVLQFQDWEANANASAGHRDGPGRSPRGARFIFIDLSGCLYLAFPFILSIIKRTIYYL